MNWVDLGILIVAALFAYQGYRRGLVVQLIDIVGFLVSLVASLAFYPAAAEVLSHFFKFPKIAANPVGFLLIWLVTEALFFTIFSSIFRKHLPGLLDKPFNKYLGFIPAILNALLFLAFVLLFTVSLPINPIVKKDIFNSKIGSQLVDNATLLERPFNSIFGPIAKQSLTFLTVKPEEKGSVDLGYKQKQTTVDFEAERIMLELVNTEREKIGVKSLVWDEDRAKVAREHSGDMYARGYFSHFSPEGKDVGERLDEAGIDYTVAGENLALAPDVNRAHTGFINSPGHKRNILDPAFRKIGIGAIDGGVYGMMFTQVFTN
ncbi:MAG: CvpA family protein [Candidatus Curtissbacteria bacterium]|nr:CvpA family protein [Candidatus Curtissbacteria bacterium]